MSIGHHGDSHRAVHLGLGMSSPLWSTFILAAGAGMAYWAWSRFLQQDRPLLEGVSPAPAEGKAPAAQAEPTLAPRPSAAPPEVVLAEEPAAQLDESLAVQAAPEPKPPLEPPHEPTIIEAVAPRTPGRAAKADHKAEMLATAATREPKARAPRKPAVKAAPSPKLPTAEAAPAPAPKRRAPARAATTTATASRKRRAPAAEV